MIYLIRRYKLFFIIFLLVSFHFYYGVLVKERGGDTIRL